MSESWKNRHWSLLLVCTFAIVLSVCNKAMDSSSGGSKSSSGGIAYADFKPSDISAVMFCRDFSYSDGVTTFSACDSSDSTSLDSSNSYSITLGDVISSGFRPCNSPAFVRTYTGRGHFFFCK